MRYANLFDFWFDKRQRYVSLISLRMLNFLIQLWGMKIDTVLFQWSSVLRKSG